MSALLSSSEKRERNDHSLGMSSALTFHSEKLALCILDFILLQIDNNNFIEKDDLIASLPLHAVAVLSRHTVSI